MFPLAEFSQRFELLGVTFHHRVVLITVIVTGKKDILG
jgi:hypothetical protein